MTRQRPSLFFNRQTRAIWLLALAIVILAGVVRVTNCWHEYQVIDKEERQKLATQARLADEYVGGLVRSINLALDEITAATIREGHCDPKLLDHFAALYPEFRAFSVVDNQGINRCASRRDLVGLDQSTENYLQLAQAKSLDGALVIDPPMRSKLDGVPILIFHKAKTDPSGRLQMIAKISVDLRYFDTLLEARRTPKQTVFVANENGLILSRVPNPEKYRLLDLSKSPSAFSEHRNSGQKNSTHKIVTATDRLERFVSIADIMPANISPAPRGHLIIGVGETVDDVYAHWRRDNWFAFATWLVIALTIFSLAWLVSRRKAQLQQEIEQRETNAKVLARLTGELVQMNEALDAHAIVSASDIAGNIILANAKFCDISGYTREELIGQNHNIVNSGTHSAAFFQQMWQTIASGKIWHGLICNRAKDGHHYWVNSTIVPIFDHHGQIDRYISIRTDVSALVQIEDDLRQAKEEAVAANKTKSDFLSNMSHELRTPLNAILGFSQLLQAGDISPDTREDVDHIHMAGKHLLTLINEVLDLAKIESGKVEIQMDIIDVDHLIRDNLELIKPFASSNNIELVYLPAKEALTVKSDRNRLDQVLLNLISNAIKYNRALGKVSIHPERRDDKRVRINITDTGIGLTPEDLLQLFTPFTRLGPKHIEGTGIGLTLTKRLVELMNGELGVDSEAGVGSTFWIEFAETQASAEDQADMAQAQPCVADRVATRPSKATILCIEDNAINMLFMQKVLRKIPQAQLLTAAEPHSGLQLARAHHPDLILLDINLPEISGYEVLRQLRADPETRDIMVVAISANAMPGDLEKGKIAGFDDYLTKPININELLATVNRHLA